MRLPGHVWDYKFYHAPLVQTEATSPLHSQFKIMVDMLNSAAAVPDPTVLDKDAPLKEDIRLLGRLLGDVLRDQEGEEVFNVVETIRQTAVRFRREDDAEADVELRTLLKKLSREQTISVVRAFSYFSHLANIAEDQHHIRRRRAHLLAGSKPQAGSVGFALRQTQGGRRRRRHRQGFFRRSADRAGADRAPDRGAA